MDSFRAQTIKLLAKKAGVLENFVRSKLEETEKPIEYKPVGISLGPGTQVIMPEHPVKPDGTVNIMFQFRGGNTQSLSKSGVNTVVVLADAGGIGGGPSRKAFGRPDFVNQGVSTILSHLKKATGRNDIRLGKLGFSGFSGGYAPIWGILQGDQSGYGKLIKQPDYVGLFDGMHHSVKPGNPAMQIWQNLAEKAMRGETDFVITHTAIKPPYASTTQTSDYLLNNLGLERQRLNTTPDGFQPVSVAGTGNFRVYQLYDKQDPSIGKGEIRPGTAEYQHVQALKSMPQYWPKNWN